MPSVNRARPTAKSSLGARERLLDVAQGGVVGQQHPVRDRGTVGERDDGGMRPWVGPACHGQRPVEVVAPPRTAVALAQRGTARRALHSQVREPEG
jgi:hypothetical protein